MKAKELALKLNGRQYREEITKEESKVAKENGLVVVFGASDDLMEFEGAIYDEVDCYEGGSAHINSSGRITDHLQGAQINAIWRPKNGDGEVYSSWLITSEIENYSFDIFEEEKLYCRGIVFNLSAVNSSQLN